MADQAMTYDEAASLASNSYTKTGYTFTGWNTQGDGSGTAYGDGEKVKNPVSYTHLDVYKRQEFTAATSSIWIMY